MRGYTSSAEIRESMRRDLRLLRQERDTLCAENERLREKIKDLEQVASMNPRRHELLTAKFSGEPYDEAELEMLQEQVSKAFYNGVPLLEHMKLQEENERLRTELDECHDILDEDNRCRRELSELLGHEAGEAEWGWGKVYWGVERLRKHRDEAVKLSKSLMEEYVGDDDHDDMCRSQVKSYRDGGWKCSGLACDCRVPEFRALLREMEE